jgi:hypothetical protein
VTVGFERLAELDGLLDGAPRAPDRTAGLVAAGGGKPIVDRGAVAELLRAMVQLARRREAMERLSE